MGFIRVKEKKIPTMLCNPRILCIYCVYCVVLQCKHCESLFHPLDLNECEVGNNTCDVNAECYNLNGTYGCTCNEGFAGDGFECEGVSKISNIYLLPDLLCI